MHLEFTFRDGTAIYTYTLEKQEDDTMKRTVLDTRALNRNKDVVRENPEFDNLVRCTKSYTGQEEYCSAVCVHASVST